MILQLKSQTGGSIRQVCQAMGLPRSSFYHAAEVTHSHHEDVRMGGLLRRFLNAIVAVTVTAGSIRNSAIMTSCVLPPDCAGS